MKSNLEMSNQSLDLHPETKRLREEHDELKKLFSDLFMQKQHMELHDKPLLIALYLQKIGYKEYNLYRLNVELAKLKQRLALMQAYVNRNEKPDIEKVNKEVEIQFVEYQKKIEQDANQLAAANNFLKGEFLAPEQVKKLKEIYYVIVKRLHPDINSDLSDEMKELFVQARTAYDLSDMGVLQQILLLLDNKQMDKEVMPTDLQDTIKKVKENVDLLKKYLEKLNNQFPFTQAENLENEEWLTSKHETLDKEIELMTEGIEKYKNYVTLLEEWKPE